MTNVFADQTKFMVACDQTVDTYNSEQYKLYLNLIREEYNELMVALDQEDLVEQLDALEDLIVVIVGAMNSAGFNGEGAWNEVMRTNFAKIDPETGKVRKREDGKVLKPDGWTAPVLEPFIKK